MDLEALVEDAGYRDMKRPKQRNRNTDLTLPMLLRRINLQLRETLWGRLLMV